MNLYVEASYTEHAARNTGIQRVVRNVLRNLLHLRAEEDVDSVPVIFRGGEFFIAGTEDVLRDKSLGGAEPEVKWIDRPGTIQQKYLLPWLIMGYSWLVALGICRRPEPLNPDGSPNRNRLVDRVGQRRGPHVLLILDSSWEFDMWPEVIRLKRLGITVVSVIYDLIPITHSDLVPEQLARVFRRWMNQNFSAIDGAVTISRTTLAAVQRYICENPALRGTSPLPMSHFYLGAELDLLQYNNDVQECVTALGSDPAPIFLMVGTIEPRKNHAQVFSAFKMLWAEGVDTKLVIAGSHTWSSTVLRKEFELHPEFGRRLIVLDNGSDADINFLYKNCSALIMASIQEGFGLPIVEARLHGLPVLCSDIPIFRELSAEGTAFFRLHDPADLARAVGAFISHPGPRTRAAAGWITWEESTRQLLAAIRKILDHNS